MNSAKRHTWSSNYPARTWLCTNCGAVLESFAGPCSFSEREDSHEMVFMPFEEALRGGGNWVASQLPAACPRTVDAVMES